MGWNTKCWHQLLAVLHCVHVHWFTRLNAISSFVLVCRIVPDWWCPIFGPVYRSWDSLETFTLNEIFIPGTHDAGSASMSNALYSIITRTQSLGNCYVIVCSCFCAYVWWHTNPWSCNSSTRYQYWKSFSGFYRQLLYGVRYFDIRVAMDDNKNYRIIHSGIAPVAKIRSQSE